MDDETFRSRLVELMKRSRKALRVYSSYSRSSDPASRHLEAQSVQWKEVNAELLRQLSTALDQPNNRKLALDIQIIRDRFDQEWRAAESELQAQQARLLTAAQNGDFIRSAVVSSELVAVKARFQAAQAAHQELNDVLRKSRVAEASIELPATDEIAEQKESEKIRPTIVKPLRMGKVIPLSRTSAG